MTTDITAKDFNPSGNDLVGLIKGKANDLAEAVNNLPASRRRSVALTHIETASMFAVKAVFYNDENERIEEGASK
jgi:hypothetical protein|tara:strand:+ start:312 stop:536 length:225 start_codon:yes stop_codon:yes gene_type:complete